MTIKALAAKHVAKREIARQLGLSEITVRYQLKRIEVDAQEGCSTQRRAAVDFTVAIEHWHGSADNLGNSAALHEWLVEAHGYSASLRSLQRYLADRFPAPVIDHGAVSGWQLPRGVTL